MLHEERDVVAAFPERGDGKNRGVQPVEKVLPELALPDQLREVLVRRGNEAHVHSNGVISSQPPDLVVLQRPEDFGLDAERHVADLIKKEGAPVCFLEQALENGIRPRVRALLMAEELVVEKRLGEGDAVDLHHGRGASRGRRMRVVSQDLFPRPALSTDQQRKVGGGKLFHLADQCPHAGIPGNDGC